MPFVIIFQLHHSSLVRKLFPLAALAKYITKNETIFLYQQRSPKDSVKKGVRKYHDRDQTILFFVMSTITLK